jgi:hypothetical protein
MAKDKNHGSCVATHDQREAAVANIEHIRRLQLESEKLRKDKKSKQGWRWRPCRKPVDGVVEEKDNEADLGCTLFYGPRRGEANKNGD